MYLIKYYYLLYNTKTKKNKSVTILKLRFFFILKLINIHLYYEKSYFIDIVKEYKLNETNGTLIIEENSLSKGMYL